jgi:hypothetical protein
MAVDLQTIMNNRNASNAAIRRQQLRDDLASKAMQSLVTVWNPTATSQLDLNDIAAIATNAYIIADAMLEVRDTN